MPRAKKSNPEPYDRVARRGRTGTVVQFHKDGKSVSVLADDRPRSLGAELWPQDECQLTPALSHCPRCEQKHSVFACPDGK